MCRLVSDSLSLVGVVIAPIDRHGRGEDRHAWRGAGVHAVRSLWKPPP